MMINDDVIEEQIKKLHVQVCLLGQFVSMICPFYAKFRQL